ncbi:hypothetical protein [Proteus terrae]|nr:hypothetical protein [Proteus terrae]
MNKHGPFVTAIAAHPTRAPCNDVLLRKTMGAMCGMRCWWG